MTWKAGKIPQEEGEYIIQHGDKEAAVRLIRTVDWTAAYDHMSDLASDGELDVDDIPDIIDDYSLWIWVFTQQEEPYEYESIHYDQWRPLDSYR